MTNPVQSTGSCESCPALKALGLALLFGALATCTGRAADRASPPHVVVIMADDMGYGDLGCYGASMISTPHCDRLAREGRRFTDAHAPSASCSPTRFGLLTGGYPWRVWRRLFFRSDDN